MFTTRMNYQKETYERKAGIKGRDVPIEVFRSVFGALRVSHISDVLSPFHDSYADYRNERQWRSEILYVRSDGSSLDD